jgi:hypothetical protein
MSLCASASWAAWAGCTAAFAPVAALSASGFVLALQAAKLAARARIVAPMRGFLTLGSSLEKTALRRNV